MKSIARALFRSVARLVLRRYQPTVVAVAGSIGKTATREAIYAAVHGHTSARQTSGNFNAEIGVPITIISGGAARRSVSGWMATWLSGWRSLVVRINYPKVLILELGTDKPGDLDPLLHLVRPHVGVLTAIAPEHLEFFGDLDAVAVEESTVVTDLSLGQVAVVNADDELAQRFVPNLRARVIPYGWNPTAAVRAEHLDIVRNDHGLPTGQIVKVAIAGNVVPIGLPGILGRHQVYPALAALAVTQALEFPLADAVKGLAAYQPPPGRMRLFEGVEGSLLIDDSYNASPNAMAAALKTLADVDIPGRKFAVLGQMSELGSAALHWHEWVAERIPPTLEGLLTVGPLADHIGQKAIQRGFPANRVTNVADAAAAAVKLRPLLHSGDAILFKSSRYAGRLERAVALLLANPERDRSKLVGADERA